MIVIIDYGMGNLRSVAKSLENMNIETVISDDAAVIKKAKGVILPGVGAFGEAVANLNKRNLFPVVLDVINSGKPFLGICLGLQLLFEESEEEPGVRGLGLFRGTVKRFRHDLKVPHMGWNQVKKTQDIPWLADVSSGDYFYFVHSYYVAPEDDIAATTTDYGQTFVSSVAKENLFACQFHPEKSQDKGLTIIKRFGESI